MDIDEQTVSDIRRLLEDGVDDFWWTAEYNGCYSLVNRLREKFGLEKITEERLKESQEYWRNL